MKSIIQLLENETTENDLIIHRIVGIERFLQMLHETALALMAPKKWDDPYEKSLQTHYERHGRSLDGFKVYGLCWSTESRSDALWRIYSPARLGIKISTTVSKLAAALDSGSTDKSLLENTFLGRVAYLPERTRRSGGFQWPTGALRLAASDFKNPISTFANAIAEIIQFAPSGNLSDDVPSLARAFLVKRRAFRHEDEVRLLCFPTTAHRKGLQSERDVSNQIIQLRVPMSELLTQIEFDPRMGDDIFDALKYFVTPILERLNINKRIKKSTLYRIPLAKGFKEDVD